MPPYERLIFTKNDYSNPTKAASDLKFGKPMQKPEKLVLGFWSIRLINWILVRLVPVSVFGKKFRFRGTLLKIKKKFHFGVIHCIAKLLLYSNKAL